MSTSSNNCICPFQVSTHSGDPIRQNIVFIDPFVEDYPSLVAGIMPGTEVVLLDSTQDGVVQISKHLRSCPDMASVHIVSHGSPGCLYLGNSKLSLETLESYASDLQTWFSPSLFLYGCNVAAGDAGAEFVEKLHRLTGAQIAASANPIGNPAKGGSWQLEHRTGQIDSDLVFLPALMQTYSGVFAVDFDEVTGSPFGVGNSPNSIAQGDFDGDGDVDLVTANFGSVLQHDDGTVSVLLNDGTGSFGLATNFAVTGSTSSVAVGDFNEDGNLDLAVANYDLDSSLSDTVSVLLGNGNGSFSSATDFITGGSVALTVAVADFNGDNHQDLVVGSFDGTVSVLSGNGTGSFAPASELTVQISGFSISVGDVNNDTNPDILVGGGTSALSLLLNDGFGGFGLPQDIPTDVSWASAGALEDLNGDGYLDIVVGSNSGTVDEIAVLLGNGNGSFGTPTKFTVGGGSEVSVADFNADGNLDIAAASPIDDKVSLLLGDGTGNFDPSSAFDVVDNPTAIVVEDFNGDGKPDFATANNDSNDVSVLLNTTSFPTLTVDTLVDENDGNLSPGDVSLREALAYISSGGTIDFDPSLANSDIGLGLGTIALTEGQLKIDKSLTLNGLGAENLTISGNNASRVFLVDDGDENNLINVEIDALTITEGNNTASLGIGAGIRNDENLTVTNSIITNNKSTGYGAGISNSGDLKLIDSTVSNNEISNFSSSLAPFKSGGGIFNFSDSYLEIERSTISENKANLGGGIYNFGDLHITNSTISGNTAGTEGGGIQLSGSNATADISFSTIVNNESIVASSRGSGGGIVALTGTPNISNSIIAGNSGVNPDLQGSFISNGYNLIGDLQGSTGFNTSEKLNDPLDSVIDTTLQDNGGLTQTHALIFDLNNPAIDAADPFASVTIDQRGVIRPQGNGFDIGAFELEEDEYEFNNTLGTAYDLTNQEQTLLSNINGFGVANNDDWYKIEVLPGEEHLVVDLQFTHADGDLDLILYDSSGLEVGDSNSVTDNESINLSINSSGTYYLQVYPYQSDNAGNTYDLWWGAFEEEDNYDEPNNRLETAYDLTDQAQTWLNDIDGLGVANNDDWYKIEIGSNSQLLHVDLEFTHADGDIDVALYDESGSFVTSATSSTDNESIDTPLDSGIYYLNVDPISSFGNTYNLRWDVEDINDDNYEPNNSLETAYDLTGQEQTLLNDIDGLGIANTDDWYKIEMSPDSNHLLVDLEFTHANGDIDLELYDEFGSFIMGSTSTTDNESIDTQLNPGIYYLNVYPYSDFGNTYNLRWDDVVL